MNDMLNRFFYTLVFLAIAFGVSAQDIHYSQFYNTPLNLNPGLTGVYNGSQRYHLNVKNQWNNPVGYNSFDIGADFKLDKGFKKNYFGLGALINYDVAGDLGLKATGINGFLSYTLGLGENLALTPGLNAGFVGRSYGWNDALWVNDGAGANPDAILTTSTSYFDLNGGLNLRYSSSLRKTLDVGVGLFHLNTPSVKFGGANYEVDLDQKMQLYAMFNWPLADKLDIWVNGLYSTQVPYQQIDLNAQAKIYLGDTYTKALYLGVGARLADVDQSANNGLESIYPIIGLQLNNLRAEFNYDFTTSPFQHAAVGGPEFSLMYIISRVPTQVCKPCPIY
jgi:type IX secretion system PorP/SprF family membrane protein